MLALLDQKNRLRRERDEFRRRLEQYEVPSGSDIGEPQSLSDPDVRDVQARVPTADARASAEPVLYDPQNEPKIDSLAELEESKAAAPQLIEEVTKALGLKDGQ